MWKGKPRTTLKPKLNFWCFFFSLKIKIMGILWLFSMIHFYLFWTHPLITNYNICFFECHLYWYSSGMGSGSAGKEGGPFKTLLRQQTQSALEQRVRHFILPFLLYWSKNLFCSKLMFAVTFCLKACIFRSELTTNVDCLIALLYTNYLNISILLKHWEKRSN